MFLRVVILSFSCRCVSSPHHCVGFLFVDLHPVPSPPPSPRSLPSNLCSLNSSHTTQLTQLISLHSSHMTPLTHLISQNSPHTNQLTQFLSHNSSHSTQVTQLTSLKSFFVKLISHNLYQSTHLTHLFSLNSLLVLLLRGWRNSLTLWSAGACLDAAGLRLLSRGEAFGAPGAAFVWPVQHLLLEHPSPPLRPPPPCST